MSEKDSSKIAKIENQIALIDERFNRAAKPAPKKVLDEETYLKDLKKIIERDFFPDLEKLRVQQTYLEAVKNNDTITLRELHAKYSMRRTSPSKSQPYFSPSTFETPDIDPRQTPRESNNGKKKYDTPFVNDEPPPKIERSDLNLDRYLANNTSEDNISFVTIMHEADKKENCKVHRAWLFEQERLAKERQDTALALPSIEKQAAIEDKDRAASLDTWSYKAKNSLMYIPEGVALTFEEQLEVAKKTRVINHENTRFIAAPFDPNKLQVGATENRLTNIAPKLGVDGKELSSATPKINGYGFVPATPSPVPGRSAGDESPMMFWGEIEGTPFRLDGSATPSSYHSGTGPEFKIPDIPEREKIALGLEEKANAARRKRKVDALTHVQRSLASPRADRGSMSDKISYLSPSAQKLLSTKLSVRPGSSSRGATPSPSASPSLLASPATSILSSPKLSKSSDKSLSNLKAMLKRPTDSLTDDLLKLPKQN